MYKHKTHLVNGEGKAICNPKGNPALHGLTPHVPDVTCKNCHKIISAQAVDVIRKARAQRDQPELPGVSQVVDQEPKRVTADGYYFKDFIRMNVNYEYRGPDGWKLDTIPSTGALRTSGGLGDALRPICNTQDYRVADIEKVKRYHIANCWTNPVDDITSVKTEAELKEEREVNHPAHYASDPSGVECIQITEHRNFCIGNAIKYLWRNGLKAGESNTKDLKKAVWYINREIERLENQDDKV